MDKFSLNQIDTEIENQAKEKISQMSVGEIKSASKKEKTKNILITSLCTIIACLIMSYIPFTESITSPLSVFALILMFSSLTICLIGIILTVKNKPEKVVFTLIKRQIGASIKKQLKNNAKTQLFENFNISKAFI